MSGIKQALFYSTLAGLETSDLRLPENSLISRKYLPGLVPFLVAAASDHVLPNFNIASLFYISLYP